MPTMMRWIQILNPDRPGRRLAAIGCLAAGCLFLALSVDAAKQPNIVLIFTDDQGYNDLGCFGSKTIKTPNIDQMAKEGMRFTSFYAQAVCGPSRAALMTGCYPIRVAEPGNKKNQHTIPHTQEITVAEVLNEAGYATGCIGKWHLGQRTKGGNGWDPETMPNGQGFDYYYGTPLYNGFTVFVDDTKFRSPILRNQEIVTKSVESWDNITSDYTKEAIGFIRRNQAKPFFLYLAHNMPHIPVGASERFRGKSEYGPYGDTIEEIDWSTGEILKTLKKLKLEDDTLVVFTSDNGPWIETTRGMQPGIAPFIPTDHSGTADPLRGYKMLTWEGGLRVPCVMRWPGRIPAGKTTAQLAATIDLLPTFAKLAGATLPSNRQIDGTDISDLWSSTEAAPRKEMLYYSYTHLQAIRNEQWKLVVPRPEHPRWVGWSGRFVGNGVPTVELYDLKNDLGEARNVASANPKIVAKLMARIVEVRAEVGDYDTIGTGARFFDDAPKRPEIRKLSSNKGSAPKKPQAGPSIIYEHPAPVGSLQFDFEKGDLQGWRVVSGGFEALVNKRANFHHALGSAKYNKQGDFYLSTLERKAGGSGNDSQTGVVESPVFTVKGKNASFLIGGGKHPNTHVALVNAADGKQLLKANGRHNEQMFRINWDLSKFNGMSVFLRLVDQNKGGWGHVTFDDFSATAELDDVATQSRWSKLKAQPAKQAKPVTPQWKRPESGITHSFLATGGTTYILNGDGKVTWKHPMKSRDGWVLPNGNVLLAVSKSKTFPHGGVIEVKQDGTKVFEYQGTQSEVNTAQALKNGNIMLTEAGPKPRLLEVTRDGTIAVEVPLKCQLKNHHMQSRMARKLPNGNYLVPQLHDKVVREYSPEGKIVWEVKTPHWPFTAIRLEDGNTLINCTYGNVSIEVDREGDTVWQLSNDDLPAPLIKDACGAQRLPNGNTVITCYGNRGENVKLLEVTPEKELVWVHESAQPHGIHHFQILDTNGRPIENARR
jgi:arylsulfatase A-like enzyme